MMRSFSAKSRSPIDRFISEFDIALRAMLVGQTTKDLFQVLILMTSKR